MPQSTKVVSRPPRRYAFTHRSDSKGRGSMSLKTFGAGSLLRAGLMRRALLVNVFLDHERHLHVDAEHDVAVFDRALDPFHLEP